MKTYDQQVIKTDGVYRLVQVQKATDLKQCSHIRALLEDVERKGWTVFKKLNNGSSILFIYKYTHEQAAS